MLNSTLKSQIDKLREIFWSGGLSNPLTAVEQISYLIFMYRIDILDSQRVAKAKRLGQDYTSLFDGTYVDGDKSYDKQKLRRSHWTQMSADQMFPYVRDVVFPFIKELDTGDGFAGSLKDASFLIPKASMLVTATTTINDLQITAQNDDTAGDIYEYLLSEISSAGKNGQFRTPRHIIQMIVDIVNPTKHDKVCDPACGTAWFLINAYKHIIKENTSKDGIIKDEWWEEQYTGDMLSKEDRKRVKNEWLIGYDIDSTMVRIALMNSILHWVDSPNIVYGDTLGKQYKLTPEYDIVLANPPFKWSIDAGDMNENFSLSTKKTELLFLELILEKLTIWGKAGVIVPDGVLFGSSKAHKHIREKIIEDNELKAVISLPSGVFKPYAWVSTAILIFTKGDETKKVWYYDLQNDGYSLDDKRNEIEWSNVPEIQSLYKDLVLGRKYDTEPKEWDNWFWVTKEEIQEEWYDLSLNKYKEIVYETIEYEKPEILIKQIREIENSILQGMDELEEMLG